MNQERNLISKHTLPEIMDLIKLQEVVPQANMMIVLDIVPLQICKSSRPQEEVVFFKYKYRLNAYQMTQT